jgi:hypothetical protein
MVNVPQDFQDYDDDDPNIQFRRDRAKYWAALKEIRNEYNIDNAVFDNHRFINWVKEKYGFVIAINIGTSFISDTYTVIDEAKFIFFKLKYM